jgi:lipopolysaccharide heptosyltransferase II
MGDVLMSSPAFAALKETFNAKITILTSSMAKDIVPHITVIDDVMIYDVPWVKHPAPNDATEFFTMVEEIKRRSFDAAVIFSVYSQNPLPAAMICYLAGIPRRLAYCRENPYGLFTHWIPDKEPYGFISHQVTRDLSLVKYIGATTTNEALRLSTSPDASVTGKLVDAGVDMHKPWMLFHPGVSEEKRRYPISGWIEIAKRVSNELGYQILITGTQSEYELANRIVTEAGNAVFNLAGKFSLDQFILLIDQSPIVVSVNTSTIHIAAAMNTTVVVLYALTNPQHTPWKGMGRIIPFSVPRHLQSRNEVLRFVTDTYYREDTVAEPDIVYNAIREIIVDGKIQSIPMLVVNPSGNQRGSVLDGAIDPVIDRQERYH